MSAQYDQLIYETAVRAGFTPIAAKFVVAQARFESSDYGSAVFRANNNTSGMKYIGQPLATRGTLAPYSERSSGCKAVTSSQVGGQGPSPCVNSDHYAKFASVGDSAKDKIDRLYQRTMGGVTPDQLKNAKTPDEFADLLKRRSYYGPARYGTSAAEAEIRNYAGGLRAKLLRIQVVEVIDQAVRVVKRNKVAVAAGIGLMVAGYVYWVYFRKR